MSDIEQKTVAELARQRAPWDAPQVVTVVPVDRTESGLRLTPVEDGVYRNNS